MEENCTTHTHFRVGLYEEFADKFQSCIIQLITNHSSENSVVY